ncbi:unnamed protein product [Pleuronectes platessa]|uniref:Ig-like domain-containing protein n=1 Tax=Pleuronectes platessa TaxID=8262 RepID=A0A9N7TQH5_PLEPL|nr:unnamed protein product [Pleuronectes platessa]
MSSLELTWLNALTALNKTCYVDDKVSKVAWLNRSNIIFAGQDKWSLDPRVDLVTKGQLEYSLRIQKVDVYDEGSYTCSIQTKQQPKTSQVYLIVQEALTIDFNSFGFCSTKETPETPEVFCGLKHFTHHSICIVIAHRSRGSAPRPAHSLRDTRPELLHVKELVTDSVETSAAPINDFGPQRPPECSEQHGYNAKFQQFPDI